MKANVESTEQVIDLEIRTPQPARIWKGVTENGVEFQMVVVRVAVDKEADASEFERDLQERHAPSVAPYAFDIRMIL